jgi:hypothetical protein
MSSRPAGQRYKDFSSKTKIQTEELEVQLVEHKHEALEPVTGISKRLSGKDILKSLS